MISHQHRCIFIHIPKTAGNSVRKVFGSRWQNHKDVTRYAQELDPATFRRYFKFAIVRNPWDRVLSEYVFQRRKREQSDHKLFVFSPTGVKRGFSEWVRIALADPFRYRSEFWGGNVSPHIHRWSPQLDWISIGHRLGVDFVARFEHLDHDFRLVCRRAGLAPVTLPHRNRVWHWHYSWYFDAAARELVAEYYARDIEAFGYRFESRGEGLRQTMAALLHAACRYRRAAPTTKAYHLLPDRGADAPFPVGQPAPSRAEPRTSQLVGSA